MTLQDVIAAARRLADLLEAEVAAVPERRRAVGKLDVASLLAGVRAREAFHAISREAVTQLWVTLEAWARTHGVARPTLADLQQTPEGRPLEDELARVRELSARLAREDALTQAAINGALACTKAWLRQIVPAGPAYGPRALSPAVSSTLSRRV